jgi:hypothetical protein
VTVSCSVEPGSAANVSGDNAMDLSLGLRASVVSFADSLLAALALVATLAARITNAAEMSHSATGLDRPFPDAEITMAIPRRYLFYLSIEYIPVVLLRHHLKLYSPDIIGDARRHRCLN